MDYLREKRIVYLFISFLLVFLPLLGRLADIQVFRGQEYAVQAVNQQTQRISLERLAGERALERAERGNILDRKGMPLTDPGYFYRLAVFPGLITDKEGTKSQLATLLEVYGEVLLPYLTGKPDILPFSLSGEKLEEAQTLNLPGVRVVPVYYRYGPGALARHVIGNLGKISTRDRLDQLNSETKKYRLNDLEGKQGLEALYEKELKGTHPEKSLTAFVDAGGNLIPGLGYQLDLKGIDHLRQHLVLTIDYEIQKTVERIMDENIQEGAVVVMDARNGDLLALASRPNYDQNDVARYLPRKDKALLDHTTLLYQPGSVFKVIVAAAALEEGLVSPETIFTCQGEKDPLIPCDFTPGHGRITFAQALAVSCNPTFARVGLQLGPDKLIEYARKFGLADQQIRGYKYWSDPRQDLSRVKLPHAMVNSSIGQGDILATPVQLTAMMEVVANGGIYYQPRLVRELITSGGKVTRKVLPHQGTRVISQETARALQKMLELVTSQGTGREGYVSPFGSGGKTGTAQVNKTKGISNAWFSGYAPLQDPKYVVTVLVEEGKSGGQTAAPIFKKIMASILQQEKTAWD